MPLPTFSSTAIDFEVDETQQLSVPRAPYSHDRSAYGFILISTFVAKCGHGPTVLLTGGVHGDENKGPLALFNLICSFDLGRLSGRIGD